MRYEVWTWGVVTILFALAGGCANGRAHEALPAPAAWAVTVALCLVGVLWFAFSTLALVDVFFSRSARNLENPLGHRPIA